MDASLKRTATMNSGILALFFISNTVTGLASGSTVLGLISLLAAVLTVRDTVKLYKA